MILFSLSSLLSSPLLSEKPSQKFEALMDSRSLSNPSGALSFCSLSISLALTEAQKHYLDGFVIALKP
ncbi:hypothetical protein AMTRI_Chr10g230000 [Amborella trichopoda]